jgi:hypothetical protein
VGKKFIIFDDIQFLSEINCNKLLKFFEEPPIDCQYLLLNPNNVKLISTISSRAISFTLSTNSSNKKNYFDSLKEKVISKDLTSFCEYLKKRPELEIRLISSLIDSKLLTGKQIPDAQKYIKELSTDKKYNNTPYMRHTLLYDLLQRTNKN